MKVKKLATVIAMLFVLATATHAQEEEEEVVHHPSVYAFTTKMLKKEKCQIEDGGMLCDEDAKITFRVTRVIPLPEKMQEMVFNEAAMYFHWILNVERTAANLEAAIKNNAQFRFLRMIYALGPYLPLHVYNRYYDEYLDGETENLCYFYSDCDWTNAKVRTINGELKILPIEVVSSHVAAKELDKFVKAWARENYENPFYAVRGSYTIQQALLRPGLFLQAAQLYALTNVFTDEKQAKELHEARWKHDSIWSSTAKNKSEWCSIFPSDPICR